MAMKCALGYCFETVARNSCAVAFTPTTYLDKLSRGLKTSSFLKSKFSMATLFVVIFVQLRERICQFTEVGYGMREWTVRSQNVGLHELTTYTVEEAPVWME
jgi:hypothetical protein